MLTEKKANPKTTETQEEQEVIPPEIFREMLKTNPLTLKVKPELKHLFLAALESNPENPDSIFYYLRALDLHNKQDEEKMKNKIKEWTSLKPLNVMGLLNELMPSYFLQLFVIEKISENYRDELLLALIPAFVGFLVSTPFVSCPMSEFLVELASKNPLVFGRAIAWAVRALHTQVRRRAVFVHLLETIFSVNPILRIHFSKELQSMECLSNAMIKTNDPSSMTSSFKVPEEIHPVLFPTEPTLQINHLNITDAKFNARKKHCDFMVQHTNSEYNVELHVIYEDSKCYAHKGFTLVRILNEMMREAGVDYNLIYPKLIQTSNRFRAVQLDRDFIKMQKVTESYKDLDYLLVSEKFSHDEKTNIFDLNCAAYTLFSYLFGGFYADSDGLYLYPTGHVLQTTFDHIIGFRRHMKPVSEEDLFCTSKLASILGLNSRFADFADTVLQGLEVLRTNYVAVLSIFKHVLSDWAPSEAQIEGVYNRLMVNSSSTELKRVLIELCRKASLKEMVSFDKTL